ncbi:hypothetical protein Bpfe_025002 [Biomphalaria pfeifferi]|uniref:Uncharacterized protein n=1 Tax=Biomphalaria pfeifferi TaxID=112525 RepID=A0AAD8F061_BIOPF|nr:hypothetical protein Bpfe_025002 [Biomphalaria pfeifferi]
MSSPRRNTASEYADIELSADGLPFRIFSPVGKSVITKKYSRNGFESAQVLGNFIRLGIMQRQNNFLERRNKSRAEHRRRTSLGNLSPGYEDMVDNNVVNVLSTLRHTSSLQLTGKVKHLHENKLNSSRDMFVQRENNKQFPGHPNNKHFPGHPNRSRNIEVYSAATQKSPLTKQVSTSIPVPTLSSDELNSQTCERLADRISLINKDNSKGTQFRLRFPSKSHKLRPQNIGVKTDFADAGHRLGQSKGKTECQQAAGMLTLCVFLPTQDLEDQ